MAAVAAKAQFPLGFQQSVQGAAGELGVVPVDRARQAGCGLAGGGRQLDAQPRPLAQASRQHLHDRRGLAGSRAAGEQHQALTQGGGDGLALLGVQARFGGGGHRRLVVRLAAGPLALGPLLDRSQALLQLGLPAPPAQHEAVLNDRCLRCRRGFRGVHQPARPIEGGEGGTGPVLGADPIRGRAPAIQAQFALLQGLDEGLHHGRQQGAALFGGQQPLQAVEDRGSQGAHGCPSRSRASRASTRSRLG